MSAPRRVLLCCEQYAPSVGGVQEVMRQIAERLAQRGFEVVVATGAHPQRAPTVTVNGVQVVSFPISGNQVRGITGPVGQYQEFLRNGHFDAILIKAAQQWTFDAAVDILGALPGRKVFIPCGFSGLRDPRYAAYFQQMPEWLRRFDELVFYADDYQDIAFARAHQIKHLNLIPNGVDEREFERIDPGKIRDELGIANEDDLLLSVGSMIMAKGHWEVVRAFRKARLKRPATLVINGNVPQGTPLSSLKRTAKHLLTGRWPLALEAALTSMRPGKKVLLTNLPREQLIRLYGAADLFVFASHVEYSPLVLFEAAASATPFIASDAGNSSEIAAWTRAGTILARVAGTGPSSESFARAIEAKLEGEDSLRAEGETGRRAVLGDGFTWARIVDRYVTVLGLQ